MFDFKDEMVIHVREDQKVLLEFKEGDTVRTKVVSADTLTECFKNSLKGFKFSTGLLPDKVIGLSVNSDTKSKYIVMEFSEDRANVEYEETVYENFPLPRLIFGFKITEDGKINGKKLGVIPEGMLRPEMPMYIYPFSNVRGFSLCTGTNELPEITSLHQLSGLMHYIISMPDNDDYYDAESNRLELWHRDLLEHLKDKDRQYYYDNILIPMPNKTLKDFLEGG